MAHEIDSSNGRDNFAFAGNRDDVWHGLGQEILPGDSLETIVQKAGLQWNAVAGEIGYKDEQGAQRVIDGKQVLYRSDTGADLGITSNNRYHIVQPKTVMEFFRDFLADNKLSISTAGALRGGRIVFCVAKLGKDYDFMLPGNDRIDSYARMQTSYDLSLTTDAAASTTRQVCANTMAVVNRDSQRAGYKVGHATKLNVKALQEAFGLFGESLKQTREVWNALARRKVTKAEVLPYFCDVIQIFHEDLNKKNEKTGADLVSVRLQNQLRELVTAYEDGPGSALKSANGTAYGLLNAVTYWVDHKRTAVDSKLDGRGAARLYAANFGSGAAVKAHAQELAMELSGLKLAA